jgi:3-oxoacyl-[acyl-carrier protein] reductase
MSPKTAIVTGASRGIGRAIALRLAREGARVLLTARDEKALDSTAKTIAQSGGEAHVIAADLRRPESASRIVEAASARFGSIDILVNNAGATKRGEFQALTDDDYLDGFALKFFGAVRLTREAWSHLKRSAGSVVFIAGSGGRTPGAHFTIGGPVNAALLSLTKALADQGVKDGIQVNAINPGPVRTTRLEKRLATLAAEKSVDLTAAEELFIRQEKLARIGEPEDIAAMVAFVTGREGRYLHGSIIDMDGGTTKSL